MHLIFLGFDISQDRKMGGKILDFSYSIWLSLSFIELVELTPFFNNGCDVIKFLCLAARLLELIIFINSLSTRQFAQTVYYPTDIPNPKNLYAWNRFQNYRVKVEEEYAK